MVDEYDESERGTRDANILKSHAVQLAEHFDSVQIIVTRHDAETGQTLQRSHGEGNWHARYGSAKEWVVHKEEQMREEVRGGGG